MEILQSPKTLFHPIVEKWFAEHFSEPTEIQRQAWEQIKRGHHTLIAAPTGSGKTLAAFLSIIDDLICEGINQQLSEELQVLYISPLKALSNDIERNLRFPLQGIYQEMQNAGMEGVKIKAKVRTGDTPASERSDTMKHPPQILVTTPESLYLLLTSEGGRKLLKPVKKIIIDEIHALVGSKRGSHLALSIERLQHLCGRPLQRIGISATQKPIEEVAAFLTGDPAIPCKIINTGHRRKMELGIEVPKSPLAAVMSNEVWDENYARLVQLIGEHQTTLIFVNTRRLAERVAHMLKSLLGEGTVMAHHGSMSKEHRLDAEQRLKSGKLKALVATASLELGIDIGSVDLVCQISSPRSISGFLQRVGRSGHSVLGTPKGKIFPLTCDELVESIALLDAIGRGELDRLIIPEKPLDILSQQIVAEVSAEEYSEDELYELFKRAYPYRNLERAEFDDLIAMLAEGYTTRRGRRSAYLHHDAVNGKLRARKGSRLTALMSGGAIPDNFDYDIVLQPENIMVGTLNEDFAVESMPGEIFQLGNNSWRILKIETGKVFVEDAAGQPPSIPFWLGEAPGRSDELSHAVSRFRETFSEKLGDLQHLFSGTNDNQDNTWKAAPMNWLVSKMHLSEPAADQVLMYLSSAQAALGMLPSQQQLVMERFFDEAGDMHLVIHSVFGSRINKAWGLALRKRFCRKFNFELQAAATENAIILSLGATHSFQLEEVYNYLNPATVREVLIQALLDAPMFGIRWRWNATRSLAIPRMFASRKVPPQIQRSNSEDLVALIFPDQLACQENIAGEREVPDHPLVRQTIHDCLTEVMDIHGLEQLLKKIRNGEINRHALDLREASPLAREILAAKPYAFLDDAPLEERRTNAVQTRRWIDPKEAGELGRLDEAAIDAVKKEAWPTAENPDELHDALVLTGFLTKRELTQNSWEEFAALLVQSNRAVFFEQADDIVLVSAERLVQAEKIFLNSKIITPILVPEKLLRRQNEDQRDALTEMIRSRMEALGPVTAANLVDSIDLELSQAEQALLALENEGFVFRGHFTPGTSLEEWCERRLLARINQYTLKKLRSEIAPVSPADYMSFLFTWQQLSEPVRPEGPMALQQVLETLEGFEAQAASWESDILPSRLQNYDPLWLDMLCLSGTFRWGRLHPAPLGKDGRISASPVKTTPLSLISRKNLLLWKAEILWKEEELAQVLSANAWKIYQQIAKSGASFFYDLENSSRLFKPEVESALSELVSASLVTSDSFTGLRALLVPEKHKLGSKGKNLAFTMENAGRWSLLSKVFESNNENNSSAKEETYSICKILLKRYGIIFRKALERETPIPPWRDLVKELRMMEARGEVRGGRFVSGVGGEQYALAEAIPKLRAARKNQEETFVSISAADPLNLTGFVTPGKKISASFSNRILYRNGVPVAAKEGKEIVFLAEVKPEDKWSLQNLLIQRNISPALRVYLGKGIF